jgi:hypothetical protein
MASDREKREAVPRTAQRIQQQSGGRKTFEQARDRAIKIAIKHDRKSKG